MASSLNVLMPIFPCLSMNIKLALRELHFTMKSSFSEPWNIHFRRFCATDATE